MTVLATKKVYPEHIYDLTRRQVANDYLRRELRKYLSSLSSNQWLRIDQDIKRWFDQSPYLYPVRDFWNGFWGIAMGFKLKIGLLDFISAENITWQKEELLVDQLYFGGSWPPFHPAGGEKYSSVMAVKKLYRRRDILAKEKPLAAAYQKARKRFGDFPIIVTEKKWNGKVDLVVYDGNGRLNQAILNGKTKIIAWVGRFNDKTFRPANFWVPTPLLMELTVRARSLWRQKKGAAFQELIASIKVVVGDSQSGFYELKHRALWGPPEFIRDFWAVYNKA